MPAFSAGGVGGCVLFHAIAPIGFATGVLTRRRRAVTVEERMRLRLLLLLTVLPGLSAGACATKPARDPDQSYVRYQLGVEYFQGRRIEAAIEELDKALAADPENADAHNMLGIIALKQG